MNARPIPSPHAPSVVVEDLQPRECLGWRGAKPAAGRDSLQRRQ